MVARMMRAAAVFRGDDTGRAVSAWQSTMSGLKDQSSEYVKGLKARQQQEALLRKEREVRGSFEGFFHVCLAHVLIDQ
jgi:hypothetical protein